MKYKFILFFFLLIIWQADFSQNCLGQITKDAALAVTQSSYTQKLTRTFTLSLNENGHNLCEYLKQKDEWEFSEFIFL